MPLLRNIAGYDSIQEMESAHADRLLDAVACALAERDFAACYLLGYVVEMLLKTACFRFDGIPLTADLARPLRAVAQSPRFRRGGRLHNILAWVDHLLDARLQRGQPLDPILAGELFIRVSDVASNWSETLRYRRSVPAATEAELLMRHAEWLTTRHDELWR